MSVRSHVWCRTIILMLMSMPTYCSGLVYVDPLNFELNNIKKWVNLTQHNTVSILRHQYLIMIKITNYYWCPPIILPYSQATYYYIMIFSKQLFGFHISCYSCSTSDFISLRFIIVYRLTFKIHL